MMDVILNSFQDPRSARGRSRGNEWMLKLIQHDDIWPSDPQRPGRYRSISLGISSTKLQGMCRLSSWWTKMSSQPSFTAPVEPGSAKI